MKVPLNISWLSENNLLQTAASKLGFTISKESYTAKGCRALTPTGWVTLDWESDTLMFTLQQLKEIGFEVDEGEKVFHESMVGEDIPSGTMTGTSMTRSEIVTAIAVVRDEHLAGLLVALDRLIIGESLIWDRKILWRRTA